MRHAYVERNCEARFEMSSLSQMYCAAWHGASSSGLWLAFYVITIGHQETVDARFVITIEIITLQR